jgi:protein-tyrosine phosphatase
MPFNWFKKNPYPIELPITCDIHNHLLFGIDDGATDIQMSTEMAKLYIKLGIKKVTATPHIIAGYYPNSFETIYPKCKKLIAELAFQNIPLEIEFAAEYFLDETISEKLAQNEKLLTFMENHVLIETTFINKPLNFYEIVFELISKGYKPVFAHPERYTYLFNNFSEVESIFNSGIKFQINFLSLLGYYSKESQKLSEKLIDAGMYHFLGTDAHRPKHLELMKDIFKTKAYKKIDWDKVENKCIK